MTVLKNNQVKAVILILIFSFGFTAPFYFSSGAGAVAYITKEFGLDLIARTIARKLLTDLGNGVIESINNLGVEGGQKSPSFVQNWKKYLADAQVVGENQFRAQLNYSIQKGILCDDLKSPLASAFQTRNVPFVDIGQANKNAELKQNTLVPFQSKIKCTVPDKTRAEFKKNFAKGGGWETWSRLLEPQNNLAGATLLSIEELQKQRASQEESQSKEAVAGQGFKGVKGACQQASSTQNSLCYKNCLTNQLKTGSQSKNASGTIEQICSAQCQGQTALGANAQCAFMGLTVTPAKVLGEGAADFLDSNSKFLVSSDELSEVLVSMIGAVVNKVANFATKGLTTKPSDNLTQEAPNFLPNAQQDQLNFQKIKENTDAIEKNTEEIDVNVNVNVTNPTPTPSTSHSPSPSPSVSPSTSPSTSPKLPFM